MQNFEENLKKYKKDLKSFFLDINECNTNNGNCPATATCTNTIGSYSCDCPVGTYFNPDNLNCDGKFRENFNF